MISPGVIGAVSNPAVSCLAACSRPDMSLRALLGAESCGPCSAAARFASSSARVRPAVCGLPVLGSMDEPGRGTFGDEARPPPKPEPRASEGGTKPDGTALPALAGSGPALKPKLLSWLVRLLNVPALGGEDDSDEEAAAGPEASVSAWANPPVCAVAPDGPGTVSAAELLSPRWGLVLSGRKAEGKAFIVDEVALPGVGVGGV